MLTSSRFNCSAIMLLLCAPAAAVPINLLDNAGFETGDFSGWTVGGNSPDFGVTGAGNLIGGANPGFGPNFTNVRSGDFAAFAAIAAFGGPTGSTFLSLSQTLQVLPSTLYEVGFYVNIDAPAINGVGLFGTGIDVDGLSLQLDFPLQIDMVNGFNGSGGDSFALVSGTFMTGATQTMATVNFSPLTGSGSGLAGLNFDDFFFRTPSMPVPLAGTLPLLLAGVLAWAARLGPRRSTA